MLTVIADNLPRLMECNGSRLMSPAFPAVDVDPTARDEGTAADWMALQAFNGTPIGTLINTPAKNGFYMTADMADYVDQYLAALDCGEMQVDTSFGTDLWRVGARADHIKYIARGERVEFVNGGNGNVLEHPLPSELHVDDLKYGYSLVDPEMNWTLIWHAIGYCITRQVQPDIIKLTIHQPRPHHPDGKHRTWTISYAELLELYARINATLSDPSNELRTGLSWCRRCHALASCPAATKARMNAIDATAIAFNDQLPDNALSYELDVVRMAKATLEAQLNALEEMATHRLRNGAVIDNYAMQPQFANTRWKPGIDARLLSMASKIDCEKPGTITPAEFKRRGGSEAVYNALTERPQTGIKLIRATADQRARRVLKK
jgi:hypothetical protein